MCGAVYFARGLSSGLVKIGFSRSVGWRMRSLTLEAKEPVELVAAFPTSLPLLASERAMHRRFAHLRVRGEWFRDDGAITAFVDTLPEHQRGSYVVRATGKHHRGPAHPPTPAWVKRVNGRAS